MNVNKKLFNAFKQSLPETGDYREFEVDEGHKLQKNCKRLVCGSMINNGLDGFSSFIYTTIKPISLLFLAEEDVNNEGIVVENQLTIICESDFDDAELLDINGIEYIMPNKHYFVNTFEDLDFNKIKNHFENNYLNKLKYNNFSTIEEELIKFISLVNEKLNKGDK